MASAIGSGVLAGCGDDTPTAGSSAASDGGSPWPSGYRDLSDRPLGPAAQVLTRVDGHPWAFSAPGARWTLLYFGFTSCPDMCPTTMAALAAAFRDLDARARDQFAVQFVSTDPDRDTAAQIRRWLAQFDGRFQGARAPLDTVIAAARAYGVSVMQPALSAIPATGGASPTAGMSGMSGTASMHGAQVVVLDQQGRGIGFFGEDVPPAAYVATMRRLVADSQQH